jgi:hypothetical protein
MSIASDMAERHIDGGMTSLECQQAAEIERLRAEVDAFQEVLTRGECFAFDPGTGFLHAIDGGEPDAVMYYAQFEPKDGRRLFSRSDTQRPINPRNLTYISIIDLPDSLDDSQ